MLEELDLAAQDEVGATAIGWDDDGLKESSRPDRVGEAACDGAWHRLGPKQVLVALDPQWRLGRAKDDLSSPDEASCRQIVHQQNGWQRLTDW